MAAYSSTEMRGPVLFLVANGNRKILTKRYFYAPMKCFYLAAMPASWGQTEPKGSECTPPDASKLLGMTAGGYRVRLERNFAPRSQTGDLAKQLPKQGFYLAAMPASRGQTELKGSEHTPSDASKPPRTTGGGYRVRLKWDFASANADRLRGKIAKKTRFLLSGNAGLLGSNPAQGKRIYPP
jgi:hypothetical protein